jgi:hypothetical protein
MNEEKYFPYIVREQKTLGEIDVEYAYGKSSRIVAIFLYRRGKDDFFLSYEDARSAAIATAKWLKENGIEEAE